MEDPDRMVSEAATPTRKRAWTRHHVGPGGYTDRERDLLTLLAKGFTVVEAAERMQLSVHTLRENLKAIFVKAQASTQAEAVYRALKEGVIT